MLIYWSETGSNLGHFPKIKNIFNQNGHGQGVVKIQDLKKKLSSATIYVEIFKTFGLVKLLVAILLFFDFVLLKTLILEARCLSEYKK